MATVADLHRVDGQAELIAGRIVRFPPAGHRPAEIAGRIFEALHKHKPVTASGSGYTGTVAFVVPPLSSGRESFSPDASYYDGPLPDDEMDFIPGAPTFAVEVRSKGNYGPAAEADMAAKRTDYFEAGTEVVWDVDPVDGVIRSYRADAASRPAVFSAGQVADAEPAVPGWRLSVDDLFA